MAADPVARRAAVFVVSVLLALVGGYLSRLYRGAVRFWVTVPGPGRYRAFFDFSAGGVVRTAEFTLTA